jgi:hypothetical protein
VEIIKSLVLGSTSFSDKAISEVKGLLARPSAASFDADRVLAKKDRLEPALADAAFTAGLLHDIGALVLLHAAPPDYVRALERKKELHGDSAAAEREIFGVTHAEVGAYLLGLWGIPFPIVEAVAFHHRPNEVAPESRPLVAAIHIASGLIEEMTDSDAPSAPRADIDSSGRIDVSFLREAGSRSASRRAAAKPKSCSPRPPERIASTPSLKEASMQNRKIARWDCHWRPARLALLAPPRMPRARRDGCAAEPPTPS